MRRIFLALLLALSAARAVAEEPARFFIERVDVRGARRVSRDVIVAESRLRESHAYTEAELREAASRVTRAPYLLSAEFALEKGTERGRFVLVITVNETKPFFYRLDFVPVDQRHANRHIEVQDVTLAQDNDIALGLRYFVGRRGEIHAGIEATADNRPNTADYASWVVGYTQYDVFGTRAFLTLNAKKPQDVGQQTSSIEPQIVAGIALSINQTVTLEYDRTDIRDKSFDQSQRIATLRWSFNTTNHPLLPTRGAYLTVAPIAVWQDTSGEDFVFGKPPSTFLTHDRSIGIEGGANRWWELNPRNSVGAGVASGVSVVSERGDRASSKLNGGRSGNIRFATLSFTAAHSFWSPEEVARRGDSRAQLDVKISTRADSRPGFDFLSGHTKQASLSWVRRTSWGLVRLGYAYAW